MTYPDFSLARRLEAAEAQIKATCARAYAQERPESDAAVLHVADGCAIHVGLGSPPTLKELTNVLGLGLNQPVSDADLDQIEVFYWNRKAPAQVYLSPLAHPSLLELLGRRGYRIAEFTNLLFRPLSSPASAHLTRLPVRVHRAAQPEAEIWARVVAMGFFEDQEPTHVFVDVAASLVRTSCAFAFLATVGDEPVGGGAVGVHDRVAVLFAASTLPAFRHQGVQSALLRARLEFAQATGCEWAALGAVAASSSERNAAREGFRVLYTRPTVLREGAPAQSKERPPAVAPAGGRE